MTPSLTPRSWGSEGNLRMLPSVPGSRCRLLFRSGAAAAAESFCRLGFSVSLPSTSESRGSKPKPQSTSESQPSPASSRGSASSNDRCALKGPKSDLDEGGEDDRVRVPPSARASAAGVGRSERASMGLAELCSLSPVAPSQDTHLMSSGFYSQNGRWPDPKSSKQKGGAGYFPNYSIFCILLVCCC